MTKKILIGVVGQIACGKGVLVDYLVKKLGFTAFSLSSIVHDELKKRGIKNYTRKDLQNIGDELRKKYGRDVLARKAIKLLKNLMVDNRNLKLDLEDRSSKIENQTSNLQPQDPASNFQRPSSIVIEGIRNPTEVEYLKSLPNFILIGIKAKRSLRFQRLMERRKSWDPKTWEEFLKVDRRDLGVGQKAGGQQVGKCLAYCDYVLTNNKDQRDFYRKVEKLIFIRKPNLDFFFSILNGV